ncbi:MAG: UPF0280 family protein [Bacillota bacterium]
MNSKRVYRQDSQGLRLSSFSVKIKETDLWIAVESGAYSEELPVLVEHFIWKLRRQLEDYLAENSHLVSSLEPSLLNNDAPEIARLMILQSNKAGVGFMASVAGAFAESAGCFLLDYSREVVVENGGDIFIKVDQPVTVGIYAGNSSLSGKLALRVLPEKTPLGVCTSSGTVGPSLSMGKADAVVVLSPSVPLADAVATAMGNMINSDHDFDKALEFARNLERITGALLIYRDKIAAWGDLELQKVE